ncbi:10804_t:CDS:2 [Dentiscutata erythropus]|uniref:10804_t:CDS:1 n=1 Tax=Dentiscutata erythropus TaxID=1348616 RepID=A0A9N8VS43_9GLOM|nr:10804_t:CDS:2 [Dentiscutata erythropus]
MRICQKYYGFDTKPQIVIAQNKLAFYHNEDDNINVSEYFEESFCCNKDISDVSNIINNVELVSLKEGDSFDDFDKAKLSENVNEVHKRTILCKHSGLSKPKNSEKPSTSAQILCPWHVNISCLTKSNKSFHCRPSSSVIKSDISQFYEQLLSKQQEDSRYSEQIMLWCEFNETVGHDNTADTNRYNMPFSLFIIQDDNMQSHIVAQAFVSNETTETYQWVFKMIKKATNNKCPCMFVTNGDLAIEHAIILERTKKKQFEEWKRGIPTTLNATTIFPSIESLVKYYLRPNIAYFLVKQMKKNLYYTTSYTTIEEVKSFTSSNHSQSEDIDDELNAIVMCTMYLLEHLEQNLIVEIWKVSKVTGNGAQFSLQLIVPRWIPKHQRLDAANECVHFGQRFSSTKNKATDVNIIISKHIWLQPFINDETEEVTNDDFVNELLFYGKVCDKEEESIKTQENVTNTSTSQNVIENTEVNTIQLENPRKVIGRGRPKRASYHNKDIMKDITQKTSKKKHEPYICGFCKKPGHNVVTCPNKT